MNKIILIGRLGEDPKAFGKDNAVVRFSLAVDGFKDHTNWFHCAVFGKQGAACMEYLKTGDTVCVDGSMKVDRYTDKEGKERISYDVEVGYGGAVKFLRVKSLTDGGAKPRTAESVGDYDNDGIDEIPF